MLAELLQKVPEDVVNLVMGLKPLQEKYPILEQVDLVIEGGVGGGRTMAYMVRRLFPDAFYVGIDLHPMMIPQNQTRLIGSIDLRTYQEVQKANELAGSFPENALVCADCFDEHLVRNIMWRSACRSPLLVSIDALPFLVSDTNAGERKLASDRHSIGSILSRETPFIGQLHVSSSQLWHNDGPRPGNEGYYYAMEEVAQGMNWITGRLSNALILIRK